MSSEMASLLWDNGDTVEEAEKNHDENLRKVLNRARQVNLKLNSKKMSLKKTEVKFMGHVISRDGLKTRPRQGQSC